MRSEFPLPGNPWPHDMVIRVENDPHDALTLLYARAALGLRIPEIPEVEGVPRAAASGDAELEAQWRRDWMRAWEKYEERSIRPPDAETLRLIAQTPDEELAERFLFSSRAWLERIDAAAYTDWSWSLMTSEHPRRLEETPERRSLPALIDSWRTGLQVVVELPYAAHFAERINPRHLVVSRMTRADPERYSRALALR